MATTVGVVSRHTSTKGDPRYGARGLLLTVKEALAAGA